MPTTWASSVDLHLDLGPSGRGHRGLEEALRRAIRGGQLGPGSRLPSTRALAADLGLARGTVSRAYEQLAVEGYVLTRPGAATTVARWAPFGATGPPEAVAPGAAPRPRWDLRPGSPDLTTFPRAPWLAAARRVMQRVPAAAFGYGDPLGQPALRAVLADYLGRARGVHAAPERIVVCNGYAHALFLLSCVLREQGVRTMAFEDPSLPHFHDCVRRAGLSVVGVPVDAAGIRVAELTAPAVVVTPAHQYPLGVTLDPARRAALAELARTSGTTVLEDDYDGEFRFDRSPVGALQGMAPEHVVYAGTASKTVAPGLRLAWLVLPRRLVPLVRELNRDTQRHVGVLDQLVLAELIASGGYDRHVRRCRSRYLRRRARLLAALRAHPAVPTPSGVAAGLHTVVPLPAGGPTEAEVLAAAARRSLGVEVLGPHWLGTGPHPRGVVVGFAAPPEHAFGPAVDALVAVLAETLG
jgi:GntR family transcriptional regulator/MocR family aminotransferase